MRCALIDNSSLTAVQRIMGEIPIFNKYMIDADIVAFENFIQSILFYDKIIFLDDYKEEHKVTRKQYFNNLLGVTLTTETNKILALESDRITHDILPNIEGGRLKDKDIKNFFEQLKMYLTFSWELNSSVYYLTVRVLEDIGGLDVPKYSKLSQMIYSELQEKRVVETNSSEKQVTILDSKGKPITHDYSVVDKWGKAQETNLSDQLLTFISGVNWMSFRTAYYTLAAKNLNVDLVLHPIRQGFQLNLLSKLHVYDSSLHSRLLSELNKNAQETVSKINRLTDPIIMNNAVPLFTAWIAEKAGPKGDFINVAYELHNDKHIIEARNKLNTLEEFIQEGESKKFVETANQLVLEINKQMKRLCEKYKVETAQGIPISNIISVYNYTAPMHGIPAIPKISGNIKGLDFIKDILPKKGFAGLYRRIVNDLTVIERLGKYHDIIASKVVFAKNAGYYNTKTDQSSYQKARTFWKLPL
ncbi:hypothetical protein MJ257_22840 [Paenibacillus timonensis]|uniref:Uncharacterized protein n=1 Tax=Paenibacillus timonensis TaxID=225915 RepID=A0ABW3SJ77_9BACL|nr:hypothetical protein [Paenibacillus timonensis]MCH1642940.1 hypothetical protein [Paenibacillus timonensis]